ncbi:hypothetical protein EST38_g8313, partial [Candolleomyces aberdarensis]
MKNDILQEAARYGGVLLTHNEVASGSNGEGAILPTWTAVDVNNVKTSRDLWEHMKNEGWNVDYHRIPVPPDRNIEDNYLDAYLDVIRSTDPTKTSLVFSCGMGAVRTTFAMVAASLVRRKQLIARGMPDPYSLKTNVGGGLATGSSPGSTPNNSQLEARILLSLEQANAQQELNKSLLQLTYLLQQCLPESNSHSALELLMAKPVLLESLRKAYLGNYGVIQSLLGCLDHGLQSKKLVDRVIDATDQVVNLRDDILRYRVMYSLTSMGDAQGEGFLNKAIKSLEKYFFMIAFANFIETTADSSQRTFADWLKLLFSKLYVSQISFLRKASGSKLNVFVPVNDLSSLSKTGLETRALVPGTKNNVAISGGQILGDEYSDHVVKHRSGIILRESMLLKSDQWLRESHHVEHGVRGAINFRQIPDSNIYALGQPTAEAIDEVLQRIKASHPTSHRIIWITLREEPIVYINGAPYCLRRERFTLRNMKDYGGISASRLEVLEERLRDDVLAELESFGGRLLLHTETPDGAVVPVWEEVHPEDVMVLKDVMGSRRNFRDGVLQYNRVPITAEKPPEHADLQDLIEIVLRAGTNTPIVVNCQLGRGRSTLASIILVLIRQWLQANLAVTPAPTSRPSPLRSMSMASAHGGFEAKVAKPRHSYTVINNLLRVVRRGRAVKTAVDDAIDQCSAVYHLREAIEEAHTRAEEATDEKQKRSYAAKGIHNLRRYFELIIFQAYLQSTEPDTMESFAPIESFVKERPVIKTFEKELLGEGLDALKPLERAGNQEDVADPDEKMTLPERIEGSPNFRRVPLALRAVSSAVASSPNDSIDFVIDDMSEKGVCGSGMPPVEGLKRALERVDAGPNGKNTVYWTSLREEPVIYVAGRPHVLRQVTKPLENLEATGVTTGVVEAMEENFKKDVLRELKQGDGRILLHDEVEERPGVFSILPIWEFVSEDEIMTPQDVFSQIIREGYR